MTTHDLTALMAELDAMIRLLWFLLAAIVVLAFVIYRLWVSTSNVRYYQRRTWNRLTSMDARSRFLVPQHGETWQHYRERVEEIEVPEVADDADD